MSPQVEFPTFQENWTGSFDIHIDNLVLVSEIDLTPYFVDTSRHPKMHLFSPLERFLHYNCPMEAFLVDSDPIPPQIRPRRRRGVGKRRGRKSGTVKARRGSIPVFVADENSVLNSL